MVKSLQIHFTGDIKVQTMQRQSGIFIGERNIAMGWSAHGKENRVIGNISGQSNLLLQNHLILSDPDLVDTPIDDRDVHISVEDPGEEHSTEINLESINVEAMVNSNSLSVGKSIITGIEGNEKANYTNGNVFGSKNQIYHNVNINYDKDLIDGVINDQDIKIANVNRD